MYPNPGTGPGNHGYFPLVRSIVWWYHWYVRLYSVQDNDWLLAHHSRNIDELLWTLYLISILVFCLTTNPSRVREEAIVTSRTREGKGSFLQMGTIFQIIKIMLLALS